MDYAKNAITVTQLNKYIKDKIDLDENLSTVLIKGEISNFKAHYTGHFYFTLKDENSLIKCIMFKANAVRLDFKPKDGTKVVIAGSVSVYERDGVYQIYAKGMIEDGVGDLYAQFLKLKEKLSNQGYFDNSIKKEIPKYPKVIGVLTSKTGSVVRDIINVSTRRNPNVRIRIYPVPVQGEGASIKIANAVTYMNENELADVLIIARGGGSIEDLWVFNEEVLAEAIIQSKIPIISAVGHETDFTIADFVADLRAPTPSAAAELAVPDLDDTKKKILVNKDRMKRALEKKVEVVKLRYKKCTSSYAFKEPTRKINDLYIKIDNSVKCMEKIVTNNINKEKTRYMETVSKLDALSPLKTLIRGYSIAEKEGKVVSKSSQLKKDDIVKLRLCDGSFETKVL